MRRSIGVAIAIVSLSSLAQAQQVSVLGLVLGARPAKVLQVCTPEEMREARTPCWVHTPLAIGNDRTGTVLLPEFSIPEWAAGGTYTVSLDPRSRVNVLSVETASTERNYKDLLESIAARFGAPTATIDQPGTLLVRWERPSVTIEYLNTAASSRVVFKSRPEDIDASRYLGPNLVRPPTP